MLRDSLDREALWKARAEAAEGLAQAKATEAAAATRLADGERVLREKTEALLAKSEALTDKATAVADKFEKANVALTDSVAVRDKRITELEVKLKAAHKRTVWGTIGGAVGGFILKAVLF